MKDREFCSNGQCGEGGQICDKHKEKLLVEWQRMIPKRYKEASMDDFNKVVVDKVIDFLTNSKMQGLYLHGAVGCGKTHLKWAMAKHIMKNVEMLVQGQKPPVAEYDCKDLTYTFHSHYTGKINTDLVTYLKSVALSIYPVFLEDLGHGETTKSDFAINMWNMLIDEIYSNCTKVVIISNYSIEQLSSVIGLYVADRASEMCKGNVIEMSGKSKRQDNG